MFASNKTADDLSGHRPEASLANSTLISRNVTVAGRRTSVRLEPAMWQGFFDIAGRERLSIHQIATAIERRKPLETSLTAAMRVFVMAYFRAAATETGHRRAGHSRGAVELLPALECVTGA
jgi:predicted DNA-binding ribbon-helix-helix protein